jgi:hypothetical protein
MLTGVVNYDRARGAECFVGKLNQWYPGVANSRNECDPLCHHRAHRFKASFQGEGHDARRTTGYDTARTDKRIPPDKARSCIAPRTTCARRTFWTELSKWAIRCRRSRCRTRSGRGALVAASVQRAIGPDGVPGQPVTLLIRDRQASASCGAIATIVAPSFFSVPATWCKPHSSATHG